MTREEAEKEIRDAFSKVWADGIIKTLGQESCEDAISRKALIERINNAEENFKADNMESIGSDDGDPFVDGVLSGVFNIREMVIQAPSVTPQPKTAHWVKDDFTDLIKCDACGNDAYMDTTSHEQCESYFCPTCGANMRGWKKV